MTYVARKLRSVAAVLALSTLAITGCGTFEQTADCIPPPVVDCSTYASQNGAFWEEGGRHAPVDDTEAAAAIVGLMECQQPIGRSLKAFTRDLGGDPVPMASLEGSTSADPIRVWQTPNESIQLAVYLSADSDRTVKALRIRRATPYSDDPEKQYCGHENVMELEPTRGRD